MRTGTFRRLLERYGQRVAVSRAGEDLGSGLAFLQPVLVQRESRWQRAPSPLGGVRQDRYLLLGEPGLPLGGGTGTLVECKGVRYDIQEAHLIPLGEGASHWWAVLRPRGGVKTEEGTP